MLQQAIIVTKNNASDIADSLNYCTAQEIMDEADYFLNNGMTPVLVRDLFDGMKILSHIVSSGLFYANVTTTAPLNDKTFVDVVQL